MRILNITYNKLAGGLEQSFIDYAVASQKLGNEVHCLIYKSSEFEGELRKRIDNVHYSRFLRSTFFRPLLFVELKNLIGKVKPDVVIIHNERNIDVLYRAINGSCPLVAVNHGGNIKKATQFSDHIFAVNKTIAKKLEDMGFAASKITVIGNMLEI